MSQSHHDLKGRRVLVVEDEFYIALDMSDALEDHGAQVLGPIASVAEAVSLIESTDHIDAAVVDLNLRGEFAFPVARALLQRNVPFVFATGYDAEVIPAEFRHITRCEKPVDFLKVASILFRRPPPSAGQGNSPHSARS